MFVFNARCVGVHVFCTHVFSTDIFMALIKLVECNPLQRGREGRDSSTYMWTLARTHAGQLGVFFFPLRDPFFFFQWRSLHP